jgi:SnoaL-like polyketide cyclase
VIVEFELRGTHEGTFRGLPPTGRTFRCRMAAFFEFEADGLVCERVYFNTATILRQLGIAHDPLTLRGRIATVLNHPMTIGRALVRRAMRR